MNNKRSSWLVGGLSATLTGALTAAVTYGVLQSQGSAANPSGDARPVAGEKVPAAPKARKTDPFKIKLAKKDFPKNKRGQTFGSDAEASSAEEAPELIAVVGDSGKAGFVKRSDLWGDVPSSPEEAAAQSDAPPSAFNVYDVDGTTVIDTYTLVESVGVGGEVPGQ